MIVGEHADLDKAKASVQRGLLIKVDVLVEFTCCFVEFTCCFFVELFFIQLTVN